MEATYLAIYRIEDGIVVEAWAEWDNQSGLERLGHARVTTDLARIESGLAEPDRSPPDRMLGFGPDPRGASSQPSRAMRPPAPPARSAAPSRLFARCPSLDSKGAAMHRRRPTASLLPAAAVATLLGSRRVSG